MSQRLVYYNRLITKTDILHQLHSQITETQPPSSPPSLSLSDEEEKRTHGDTTRQQGRNSETNFSEGWLLSPEWSNLFIDRGEGAKLSPVQNSQSPKYLFTFWDSRSTKKTIISIDGSPWSLASWHQDSKGCQLQISWNQIDRHASCQPAARSPS